MNGEGLVEGLNNIAKERQQAEEDEAVRTRAAEINAAAVENLKRVFDFVGVDRPEARLGIVLCRVEHPDLGSGEIVGRVQGYRQKHTGDLVECWVREADALKVTFLFKGSGLSQPPSVLPEVGREYYGPGKDTQPESEFFGANYSIDHFATAQEELEAAEQRERELQGTATLFVQAASSAELNPELVTRAA